MFVLEGIIPVEADTGMIKSNLRDYYNCEAEYRNSGEKQAWKTKCRMMFCDLAVKENKQSLLELGAGTGQDSKFFMDCGFEVTAVDLSGEMVKICRGKGINTFELDFYDLSPLDKKFDCVWSMNSLLHVPKPDLPKVLQSIDSVLNENGLFYMGVYGGEDGENNWVNDISETPRFFSSYSGYNLKEVLRRVFEILSFEQFDVGRNMDFQSVVMRKK